MKRYVKASITKVNGVSIDMWYGDDIADIDDVDVRFYPNDGEYRGNLYIGRKCVGDFSAKDSVALEKVFPQIYWDALHNVPDSYWDNSTSVESATQVEEDSYVRYSAPIGPEASDMDWIAKSIAKRIERMKKRYNTDEVTTEDIIDGFRSLNDDYDAWWYLTLGRDEDIKREFTYDLIDRLKAYGIDNVVDNTFVESSTDIKSAYQLDPEKEKFYRDYPSKPSEEYMDMGSGLFYWYFTRHGVGPGSVPRGLNIIDIIDTPQGSYFLTDRVLTTKSLNYYDIKEKAPEGVE